MLAVTNASRCAEITPERSIHRYVKPCGFQSEIEHIEVMGCFCGNVVFTAILLDRLVAATSTRTVAGPSVQKEMKANQSVRMDKGTSGRALRPLLPADGRLLDARRQHGADVGGGAPAVRRDHARRGADD